MTKLLVLDSIISLVSTFPNLHRPLYQALQACALELLETDSGLAVSASSTVGERAAVLLAALPNTSGKIKSAEMWRKNIDETLGSCWARLRSVRSTFSTRSRAYFYVSFQHYLLLI